MDKTSFIQDTCEIISGLFNVVITIVDKNFIRIAGTDRYKNMIGEESLNPFVFKEVMENDKTIIISNPGEATICQYCKDINNCPEKAAIYTPLKVNKKIVGGVGIIAFTEEQKQSGIFNNDVFLKFTQKLSELISSKIEAQEYAKKLNLNLKESIAILNSVHDGVIAFNSKNKIYQINNSAQNSFGIEPEEYLKKDISLLLSKAILKKIEDEESIVDKPEKITIGDKQNPVLITAQAIKDSKRKYGTVIILKNMSEANQMAKNLLHGSDYKVFFSDIIGNSQALEKIKIFSRKIATSDSTVLIRGESGTGKEMFARAIHNDSTRKKGPFIAVNCAAIPEPLLESELFGYDEGAFTGAKKGGKIGKCELAIGGTLFLDEVGDIPLFLQVKFLRMLQERSIERVGGNRTIPVDIRIIAATNRNLEEMIINNEYREDLYYRLNVIPITLPPLRERQDDIVTVSQYFLEKYTIKLHKEISSITPESLEILKQYSWPGNLRELENAIECAVNIETDQVLTPSSLPEKIKKALTSYNSSSIDPQFGSPSPLKKTIRKAELQEIISTLDKYGWDTKGKKNAAKNLGIGIATLYRILNQQ